MACTLETRRIPELSSDGYISSRTGPPILPAEATNTHVIGRVLLPVRTTQHPFHKCRGINQSLVHGTSISLSRAQLAHNRTYCGKGTAPLLSARVRRSSLHSTDSTKMITAFYRDQGHKDGELETTRAPKRRHSAMHSQVQRRLSGMRPSSNEATGKVAAVIPRWKRATLLSPVHEELDAPELLSSPLSGYSSQSWKDEQLGLLFAEHLLEAGCRRVGVDEALAVASSVLDTIANRAGRAETLNHTSSVFQALCARQLVLQRLRCELTSRNLCPVTLHVLCLVFAMIYVGLSLQI